MENLTPFQLKCATWYEANKKVLKNIFILLLILLNLALWAWDISGIIAYQKSFKKQRELLGEITAEKINFSFFREKFSAQSLRILEVSSFILEKSPGEKNFRYDFMAQIENLNTAFAISSFEYQFKWSGGETPFEKSFFLPGEKKYLLILNQETPVRVSRDLEINFRDVNWQRIRQNPSRFLEILDGIKTKDANFSFEVAEKEGKFVSIPKFSFLAINNSFYGFWRVDSNILLLRGNLIVDVLKISLSRLKSGEERPIEIVWPHLPPTITSIEIWPEINLLDPGVFMGY